MVPKQPKTQVEKLNNIQLQSSSYGLPLAIYYGTNRGTGNLIWYGNFKATPQTQKTAGGKGLFSPSSKTTTYTYSAAVMMALGEGPIAGIGKVWKGKDLSSLAALGLTLIAGNSGQAAWSFISSYNVSGNWAQDVAYGYQLQNPAFTDQKLGYDTTAILAASAYDLGGDATIPNHGFEIISSIRSVAGTGNDCNPKDFVFDFLTNAQYGVGWATGWIGSLTAFSNYCLASGILLSPAIITPQAAAQHLSDVLLACNTDVLWSEGLLKLLPRGDATVTGNGATFTPNLTPIYDLADDDFLPGSAGPVQIVRATPADAFNEVRVEIANRANQYNVEVVAQQDQDAVERYGLRQAPIQQMHFICESSVGKVVAQTLVQRSVYVRNAYQFGLVNKYDLLEPGDLVTLTDPAIQMTRVLVRITDIEETEGGFDVKAEDVPIGIAAAALYPHDNGLRFIQDFQAAPLSVATPFIFELPADPSSTGLSIGVAAGGQSGDLRFGGCHVWVSSDNVNYQQVGTINGSSRYGTLSASITSGGSPLSVTMTSGGQLATVSAPEAANGATMMAVGTEYLDYATATLTGASAYNLTGLNRGFYNTPAAAHANGAPFARIDDGICRIEDLDLTLIGKTIYFKLTSFNAYQGGEQQLSAATAYSYTITGYMQALGVKAALAKIGDDSWLTPDEKIIVIKDKANIDNEYPTITARATALGVSTTAYGTTKTNLDSYLAGLSPAWNSMSAATPVVRTVWNSTWEAYYNTREIVLSAIDAAAALQASWSGVSGGPANVFALSGTEDIRNTLVTAAVDTSGTGGRARVDIRTSGTSTGGPVQLPATVQNVDQQWTDVNSRPANVAALSGSEDIKNALLDASVDTSGSGGRARVFVRSSGSGVGTPVALPSVVQNKDQEWADVQNAAGTRPSDNAGTTISLTTLGTDVETIVGNTFTRTGTNVTFNGGVVGPPLTGPQWAEQDIIVGNRYTTVSLDDDATNYTPGSNLIFVAYYNNSSGDFSVFSNGTTVSTSGPGAGATGKIRVEYDGANYRCMIAGTQYGPDRAASAGIKLWPKFIAFNSSQAYSGCAAGPMPDRYLDNQVDGATYGKIKSAEMTSGVPKVTIAGSGKKLGDSRNMPNVAGMNLGYKWNGAISYTSAAGTPATATISVAAGGPVSGSYSGSYSAMSVGVTGTGGTTVTYYLYVNDPTNAGGAQTLIATATALTVYQGDGYIYVGTCDVVYPSSGTGGGSGGSGGGSCPMADSWVETQRGPLRARDVAPHVDWILVISDDLTRLEWALCESNCLSWEYGGTIIADNGFEVTVSHSTPILPRGDGALMLVGELDGHELPIPNGEAIEWSRCRFRPRAEIMEVAQLKVQNRIYAAGDIAGCSIMTHNPNPKP